MAQKAKKSDTNKETKDTRVTRIKATDTAPAKKTTATSASKKPATKKAVSSPKKERTNGFVAFLGYFKGAWAELREVRWPTRRTTWGLTLAVLVFTLFFLVLIVLLDTGFKFLFEQILR